MHTTAHGDMSACTQFNICMKTDWLHEGQLGEGEGRGEGWGREEILITPSLLVSVRSIPRHQRCAACLSASKLSIPPVKK